MRWPGTSAVVIGAAIAIAIGVNGYACVFDGKYECAECEESSECSDGLRCARYDDGKKRCSKGLYGFCSKGRSIPPGWVLGTSIACVVIVAFAFSARSLRARIDE